MRDIVGIGLLIDFYGELLTQRQRYCMKEHYENDLSLAEIAEDLQISRQAVHDNLQRALWLLEDYEAKLHLVAEYHERMAVIAQLRKLIPQELLECGIDEWIQKLE